MFITNSIRRNNDPKETHPKQTKTDKWNNILKPIWDARDKVLSSGSGIEPTTSAATIILPQDPEALIERLELLLASKQAGNTGVRNELVSICDELLRQGVISEGQYKNLNMLI